MRRKLIGRIQHEHVDTCQGASRTSIPTTAAVPHWNSMQGAAARATERSLSAQRPSLCAVSPTRRELHSPCGSYLTPSKSVRRQSVKARPLRLVQGWKGGGPKKAEYRCSTPDKKGARARDFEPQDATWTSRN
eukprot:gene5163-biopygen5140